MFSLRKTRLSGLPGRIFFKVAYPLYYKGKLKKTNHAHLFGFSLTIPPGVFHPGLFFSTKILGKYLFTLDLQNKTILEMGCGSGLLSLIAASKGGFVTSVDINQSAVECTQANAHGNGLSQRIKSIQSNLFQSIPDDAKFDLVIWNPPFFPQEPAGEASMAWNAGKGYRVLREFGDKAKYHLSPGGKLILILTNRSSDSNQIIEFFLNRGFQSKQLLAKRTLFEIFTILEMTSS